MPCSSGASCGVTSRARIALSATVSELYHWNHATPMPAKPISTQRPVLRKTNMSATTSATNSPPSRNRTKVIRAVRPRSLMKRVLAISPGSAPLR